MFIPSEAELLEFLDSRPNQGRWGADDQRGTINLIGPDKVVRAAGLVQTGEQVSVSRTLPVATTANNPTPFEHVVFAPPVVESTTNAVGVALDYYGMAYHGAAYTHLDGLAHHWDRNGMWGGRDPHQHVSGHGVSWTGVEHWQSGIVTRGVLLDVPRHRNTPAVTLDFPVQGDELAEIAAAQGITVEPGDALLVYCGREEWERTTGQLYNSTKDDQGRGVRPGLAPSCLWYLRDVDASLLVWDMLDAKPVGHPTSSVHGAIYSLGLAIIDNAELGHLAERCAEQQRYDFMFVTLPLAVVGGTGSPVNPIAIF